MWTDRPSPCGESAGEGSGGSDRIRTHAVSDSTTAIRSPPSSPALTESCPRKPHISALLHATSGQDAHRDTHSRHAALWQFHQLALCAWTVAGSWKPCEQTTVSHSNLWLSCSVWAYRIVICNFLLVAARIFMLCCSISLLISVHGEGWPMLKMLSHVLGQMNSVAWFWDTSGFLRK